ncbi:crustacyanin subunit C [Penaeus vannamei]|uniref:Crustacyanin subunit C n=1 Tax=Penaeus vannamei TaxID=6689 RepID=A0A3R7PXN3_PENVA|nr:crustacyanin subunit C [Penaeus vannamei]
MKTSLLCLALVAVVAADRIPGFVVPGKCPAVDERMLYSQQKPNYQRATWMAPYVILDTDYENFSCIYSCAGHNFGYYADFAFIFSRSPTLADRYYRRCESAFMNIGVDPSRFSKTAQGASCSYNTNYRSW